MLSDRSLKPGKNLGCALASICRADARKELPGTQFVSLSDGGIESLVSLVYTFHALRKVVAKPRLAIARCDPVAAEFLAPLKAFDEACAAFGVVQLKNPLGVALPDLLRSEALLADVRRRISSELADGSPAAPDLAGSQSPETSEHSPEPSRAKPPLVLLAPLYMEQLVDAAYAQIVSPRADEELLPRLLKENPRSFAFPLGSLAGFKVHASVMSSEFQGFTARHGLASISERTFLVPNSRRYLRGAVAEPFVTGSTRHPEGYFKLSRSLELFGWNLSGSEFPRDVYLEAERAVDRLIAAHGEGILRGELVFSEAYPGAGADARVTRPFSIPRAMLIDTLFTLCTAGVRESPLVVVGFSGGKDSLCTAILCLLVRYAWECLSEDLRAGGRLRPFLPRLCLASFDPQLPGFQGDVIAALAPREVRFGQAVFAETRAERALDPAAAGPRRAVAYKIRHDVVGFPLLPKTQDLEDGQGICFLCAKYRRGLLMKHADSLREELHPALPAAAGVYLALGHHLLDHLETVLITATRCGAPFGMRALYSSRQKRGEPGAVIETIDAAGAGVCGTHGQQNTRGTRDKPDGHTQNGAETVSIFRPLLWCGEAEIRALMASGGAPDERGLGGIRAVSSDAAECNLAAEREVQPERTRIREFLRELPEATLRGMGRYLWASTSVMLSKMPEHAIRAK